MNRIDRSPDFPGDGSLDRLLMRHFDGMTPADHDAAARTARRLAAAPLPRQKGTPWLRWPAILLTLDLTPAWPRVAALASCAALGFMIGVAGLDAHIDMASARTVAASADLSSLVYDAEPLTGLWP